MDSNNIVVFSIVVATGSFMYELKTYNCKNRGVRGAELSSLCILLYIQTLIWKMIGIKGYT